MKKKMRQASMKLLVWSIVWALTVVLAAIAPKLLWRRKPSPDDCGTTDQPRGWRRYDRSESRLSCGLR